MEVKLMELVHEGARLISRARHTRLQGREYMKSR